MQLCPTETLSSPAISCSLYRGGSLPPCVAVSGTNTVTLSASSHYLSTKYIHSQNTLNFEEKCDLFLLSAAGEIGFFSVAPGDGPPAVGPVHGSTSYWCCSVSHTHFWTATPQTPPTQAAVEPSVLSHGCSSRPPFLLQDRGGERMRGRNIFILSLHLRWGLMMPYCVTSCCKLFRE